MAFLDKLTELGNAISSKGQEAANKAKEMSGVSQIKSKIATAENGIRQVYAELGTKVFEEHEDWIGANYPDLLQKVNEFKANIEQYNQDIENLKQSTAEANAAIQEAQKARAAASAQAAAEAAAKKAEEAAAQATASTAESIGDVAAAEEAAETPSGDSVQ